jgi:signal transduction histidine kinase
MMRRANEMLERLRDFSRQDLEIRVDEVDLNKLTREAVRLAKPRMASRGGRVSKLIEELATPRLVPARSSEVDGTRSGDGLRLHAVARRVGDARYCAGEGRDIHSLVPRSGRLN